MLLPLLLPAGDHGAPRWPRPQLLPATAAEPNVRTACTQLLPQKQTHGQCTARTTCCPYHVLYVPCAAHTMCCMYHVLHVPCAACTTCCLYHVLPVPRAVCTMCCVCCLCSACMHLGLRGLLVLRAPYGDWPVHSTMCGWLAPHPKPGGAFPSCAFFH